MSGHRHDHSCEGEHQHDESPEMGVQYSLYTKIDKMNMECLNEAVENSGKDVFKPWELRLSLDKVSNPHNQELISNVMSVTKQPSLLHFSLWRVIVTKNFSSTSRKQNLKILTIGN
jgi:hypothetical protein